MPSEARTAKKVCSRLESLLDGISAIPPGALRPQFRKREFDGHDDTRGKQRPLDYRHNRPAKNHGNRLGRNEGYGADILSQ
jgi:hypothetical protein